MQVHCKSLGVLLTRLDEQEILQMKKRETFEKEEEMKDATFNKPR